LRRVLAQALGGALRESEERAEGAGGGAAQSAPAVTRSALVDALRVVRPAAMLGRPGAGAALGGREWDALAGLDEPKAPPLPPLRLSAPIGVRLVRGGGRGVSD
jgi:hypothetical protein